MSEHVSRYSALIQELADQAINAAVDASPHRARRGHERFSLVGMLPAASALLGFGSVATAAPPTDQPLAFVDGVGHERGVYRPFAVYLHHRVNGVCPPRSAPPPGTDRSLGLWNALCDVLSGSNDLDAIHRLVDTDHASFQPQDVNEAPDHWTYRELVGLHALYALVELCDRDELPDQPLWRRRVMEITDFHQQNTQPDYTTYQPWGLAAFLSTPDTVMFAEQQLHDVRTHLSIEGPGGALLPALLLADACASLMV